MHLHHTLGSGSAVDMINTCHLTFKDRQGMQREGHLDGLALSHAGAHRHIVAHPEGH